MQAVGCRVARDGVTFESSWAGESCLLPDVLQRSWFCLEVRKRQTVLRGLSGALKRLSEVQGAITECRPCLLARSWSNSRPVRPVSGGGQGRIWRRTDQLPRVSCVCDARACRGHELAEPQCVGRPSCRAVSEARRSFESVCGDDARQVKSAVRCGVMKRACIVQWTRERGCLEGRAAEMEKVDVVGHQYKCSVHYRVPRSRFEIRDPTSDVSGHAGPPPSLDNPPTSLQV